MSNGFVFKVRRSSNVLGDVHSVHATRIEAIDRYVAELAESVGPSVNVWPLAQGQIAFDHVVVDVCVHPY